MPATIPLSLALVEIEQVDSPVSDSAFDDHLLDP
jgi:hypothetical protein